MKAEDVIESSQSSDFIKNLIVLLKLRENDQQTIKDAVISDLNNINNFYRHCINVGESMAERTTAQNSQDLRGNDSDIICNKDVSQASCKPYTDKQNSDLLRLIELYEKADKEAFNQLIKKYGENLDLSATKNMVANYQTAELEYSSEETKEYDGYFSLKFGQYQTQKLFDILNTMKSVFMDSIHNNNPTKNAYLLGKVFQLIRDRSNLPKEVDSLSENTNTLPDVVLKYYKCIYIRMILEVAPEHATTVQRDIIAKIGFAIAREIKSIVTSSSNTAWKLLYASDHRCNTDSFDIIFDIDNLIDFFENVESKATNSEQTQPSKKKKSRGILTNFFSNKASDGDPDSVGCSNYYIK